ncbi:tumor necrosis factor receptor superfamily member wengen [Cochliomyia hominivorax]
MNNNITPAHLTNLKLIPNDSNKSSKSSSSTSSSSSKQTQFETPALPTTNEANTNSPLSRLQSITLSITEKQQHQERTNHGESNQLKEEENLYRNHYKSSCNNNSKFSNNYDKKSLYTHNTSVATTTTKTTNLSTDPMIMMMTTTTTSATRRSSWLGGLRPSTAACVTLLILTTTCSLCSASLCESQSWWDPYKDKCIPCTVCQGDMIPLRPCQMHRDTVCGSIYDLKIDWVVLSKTEPNWKERRKFDGLDYGGLDHHQLTAEQLQQLQDEADPMDWQTAALFLAVLACLLFFIVAACILVHHMRQWRRMERRLDQDVEELSTKLMAKLAEVQSLEGGTFFIGNADALRIPTTTATMTTATTFHQPQHVMLPEKSDKHQQNLQHDRRLFTNTTTLKSGNVYIEENSSKC